MNNISFDDYLMMVAYETEKECLGDVFFKSFSVTFLDYFKYLLDNKYNDLKHYILSSFDLKKLPHCCDRDIVDSILPKTENEREKKYHKKDYYYCNAVCAYKIVTSIFDDELYKCLVLNKERNPLLLKNYCHILRYILIDLSQLVNLYNINIKGNKKYDATVCRPIHTMSLHQIFRQSIYGQISFHSYSDLEVVASMANIRQIIELRIRRAFGALAYIDSCGNIKSLNFSFLLDILKNHKDDIHFPIELSSIERIYKWSNSYIHSGRGDFTWIPFFIEQHLRDFSFGREKQDGSWSYENAIRVSKKTLDKIHEELTCKVKDCSIYSCIPECEIKD